MSTKTVIDVRFTVLNFEQSEDVLLCNLYNKEFFVVNWI